MVKGSVIQFLLSQVRTATESLIGGKVYFYQPTTTDTTGIKVYTDDAGAHLVSNPYTLDADATAQLYASGKYRIVIKDAAGVTKFDRDNVTFFDFDTPYEIDAIQYGAGTFTQATIEAALTAIGTTDKVTLLLRPGTWVISSAADWSAYKNVTFKIVPGATFSGAFTITFPFNTVLEPEWWGAKGDGSTNDYAAIAALVASASTSQRVKLNGLYKISTPLVITKVIQFEPTSPTTGFVLDVGATNNGITVGTVEDGSVLIQGLEWKGFGIYGTTNCCLNGLVLKSVTHSNVDLRIQARTAATGYGVLASWNLLNNLRFTMGNIASPGATFYQPYNGFKADTTAHTVGVFNANKLDIIAESVAAGIYIFSGYNNEIKGCSEGVTANSLHLKSGINNNVTAFWSEGGVGKGSGANQIVLESESYTKIGGAVHATPADAPILPDVKVIGGIGVIVDALYCCGLSIDSTSKNTVILNMAATGQSNSNITDASDSTIQVIAPSHDNVYGTNNAGLFSDFSSIIRNGSFERWTSTTVPAGDWTISGATFTRETTIVKHGIASAMVDWTSVNDYVEIANLTRLNAATPHGFVTITGWIYIPTTGGNDVSIYEYNSGGVFAVRLIQTRDVWTKVTISWDITVKALGSIQIQPYAAATGKFYLDGWSATPGVAGGASWFTPNANEFPKYTGSATWDPGSLAAGAQEAKDFTVLGAALGMVAYAGAGVDVTDLSVSATVTAANTVTVVLHNGTASTTIDLASSTWRVVAMDISN